MRSRVSRSSSARIESRPTAISLVAEALETRTLLTGFSETVATLNVDVQAGETVTIVANANSYTLTSTGTWSGTDSANVTGNGDSSLTVTTVGLGVFDTISVTDSGAGAAFEFGGSCPILRL